MPRRLLASLMLWTVFMVLPSALPAASAADTNTPAARAAAAQAAVLAAPIPQSVFIIPKSAAEGVDPFFPLSTRLTASAGNGNMNRPPPAVELVVKGFSGSASSPLVIINDRTFGVGDEKDVTGGQGRTRVRCVEIHLKEETVIVEAGGERRELRFRSSK